MRTFNFKAKDELGRLVRGKVEANDEKSAARLVRERGLVLISLSVEAKSGLLSFLEKFGKRIKPGEVGNFTRQVSTMIGAGLPITEALDILKVQWQGKMQEVISRILADIEEGQSFSSAISKHPAVFNQTYVALMKAGETGGVLDDVLSRLSDTMERQLEFRGKVRGALIYPVIVIIGMVAVAFVMMVFVIPKMLSLYSEFGAELPTPTKILMVVSGFFARFWWFFLVFFAFFLNLLVGYRKTRSGKYKTDDLVLKIPIFGSLQRQAILTELTRTLSLLVSAGVPILDSLSISSKVVGNAVISEALDSVAKDVEKGFPVAFSFSKHPNAFPHILSQMIAVGEETGKMGEVLAKVSHVFEVESDQKVKALTAAIEPLVMIVLGIGVGFLVIAVILPIYNLTSQF